MSEMTTLLDLLAQAHKAVEADGAAMLRRAREWEVGPAATSLDPERRGWRWQSCGDASCHSCPHAVPADPTGEQVGRVDPAGTVRRDLQRAVDAAVRDLRRLVALHAVLVPVQPVNPRTVKERRQAGTEAELEGWCRSCWRDDQTCTPIETRGVGGAPYYRGLCRWCGDFEATYKVAPPLTVLRRHHEGRRVSEQEVTRALARYGTPR